MVLAHLRGLLKPYYDQGPVSVIRENIVLEALSRELDIKFHLERLEHDRAFASLVKVEDARNIYTGGLTTIEKLRTSAEHDIGRQSSGVNSSEINDFIELYKALEEAGIVGDFTKVN